MHMADALLSPAVGAAVIGLQLGTLGVVLQTVASGITSLTFSGFALLMLPIHLAIGVVEGLATAAIVLFIRRARPELVNRGGPMASTPARTRTNTTILVTGARRTTTTRTERQ
jgi:cobalt/nickel transport system permease protein